MGWDYVCDRCLLLCLPFGFVLDAENNQSTPEELQPNGERNLLTVILGVFVEEGTGVMGTHRRSPNQEATPE